MKKFIIGFLVFFGVLFLGLAIFILTFDINSYKSQIESALYDATGYSFSLKGNITISRSFEPTIEVNNVEIKNARGFDNPLLFSAKRAQISFDLKSLLKDVIVVHSIRVADVNLNLEALDSETVNWVSGKAWSKQKSENRPALTKTAGKAAKKTANIASIFMTNLNVSYSNKSNGQNFNLLFPRLSVEHLLNFSGEVVYQKEKFSFSGSIKNLIAMLETQRNLNFSFDIDSSVVKGKISGRCQDLKHCEDDMTLNMDVSGNDLQKTYGFFVNEDKRLVALPFTEQSAVRFLKSTLLVEGTLTFPKDGVTLVYNVEQNLSEKQGKGHIELDVTEKKIAHSYGIEPFSLKANYTLEDKILEISNITSMFDETDIDGMVRVTFGTEKPKIDVSLHSHYLKLSNLLYIPQKTANEKTNSNANANETESLFSNEPINFDLLKAFDGSFVINVDNLGVSNTLLTYPRIYLNANLKDSVLAVMLKEGSSIAEGEVIGKAVLNAQKGTPTLDMLLIAQDLKLNQITSWKNISRSGDVGINLFLNTEGFSLASLLGNLNGKALIVANQVDILSPAVRRLLSRDTASTTSKMAQELFIKCAVLNANIQDGVIKLSQTAALETGKFNMVVDGNVNLKDETLDLHFIPQRNKQDATASDAVQAVALKGKLSSPVPSVELDVASLLPNVLPQKISEKQAFLNSYTKKTVEDTSVCRTALGTAVFKDIDAYFGRNLVKEEVKEENPVEEPKEVTRAQKIGKDFLDSLSDVLSNTNTQEENKKTSINGTSALKSVDSSVGK